MSVLDRKLLRELVRAKGLLLAITSIIAVGVMCFIYMRSCYHNLENAKSAYYAQCRMADFWIDVKKVPVPELAAVEALPGVTDLRHRIRFFATVDLPRVREPLNAVVLSLPDRRRSVINDVVLTRGSYFTDTRASEVIVNDAFARAHALHPGQLIHMLLNNRRQELFIVGMAISSEFTYSLGPGTIVPDPEHFGVFYIKQRFAEEVFDFQGAANEVIGTLAPEIRERPDAVLDEAESLLSSYGVFNTTPRETQVSNRFVSDEIKGLGTMATIMPAIFLAVAALVLNVLMERLVEQQRVVVGTLKALGYSDAQIFRHFVRFGIVVGLLGGMLGCVMGYFMAGFVTSVYRQFYEFPNLVNRVYPGTYLVGMLISLGCSLIGTLQGARVALRLHPAEAMRAKPPASGGRVWLERIGWLWRRLSFGWRIALRNVIRNRLRTAVGAFASMVGATLLIAGFMMLAAMPYIIEFQFELTNRGDIDLVFKDEQTIDALLEARRLPGVVHAEPTLDIGCTFYNGPYQRKGGITGLVEDARLTIPRDIEERPIEIPAAGLVMTRKLAALLHVAEGETVTIRPIRGEREPKRMLVAQITESFLGLGVYANIEYLSRAVGEELAVTGVQLKAAPGGVELDELYRQLKQMPTIQAVNPKQTVVTSLEETLIETQNVFIGLLVVFAGVIFFGSVLNASLVGLAERQREVATLGVLGYGPWQIGGLFLRESMLVNLLGTLLGLPLGYALVVWVSILYDTELFRFPVVAPPSAWLKTVAYAVLFGLAAHGFVQWVIYRTNWFESLNVKE